MDEVEPERRSIFLRGAVFFANAFLILFAIDGMVSVLDSVVQPATDSAMFAVVLWVSGLLLVFALITLVLLIFVPHLPKIVLLPPLAVLVWETIGSPPFVWSLADRATLLPIDAIALGVAGLALLACKLTTGEWLLSSSRLPHKSHLVLRTLIALPVFAVLTVVSLAGVLVVGVGALIEEQTKDYLHFSTTGVEVRETVMRKGDKVVHLFATVHFAEPRFYKELYASVPAGGLILAEGITDRNGLLTSGLRYNNAAHALGLESQDVFEQLLQDGGEAGNSATPSKPAPGKPASKSDKPPAPPAARGPEVVRADVDASDFSPATIKFLQRVGDVYASANLREAMDKLSKLGNEFTDADMQGVTDDILLKRNAHVLGELDKQVPKFHIVFIPWGAEHMPGLEAGLKSRGFAIESTRTIPLARYDTILGGLTR